MLCSSPLAPAQGSGGELAERAVLWAGAEPRVGAGTHTPVLVLGAPELGLQK